MKKENICVIIALMITVCSTSPVSDDPDVIPAPEDSDGVHLWPGGTVYYKSDPSFLSEVGRDMVQDVMLDIESKSCISFEDRERKFGPDYVLITAEGSDCFSQLGRTGGPQRLNLGSACLTPEIVLHELVLTLGLDTKSRSENNQKGFTTSDQVEIALAYKCQIDQEVLVEALSDSNKKIDKTRQELSVSNKKVDNIEKLVLDLTTEAKDEAKKMNAELAKLKGKKSHHCSVNTGDITTVQGPVTFSSTKSLSSGPGGISSSTGQYTAARDGIYTLTYSLFAYNDAREKRVEVWMRKNEQQISGTKHSSTYTGPSGFVFDQGGRTMLVQLVKGDTVDVFCQDCSAWVGQISFCVSEE
eukprot:GFUD01118785.1.p1 GENE.GFUD01118785.1~~GFUD01118785.1.p1  ORF type:complete len:357 (-),score=111.86 GFUD01118785.1:58-1128(-)